jgi:peptidoglycan/xylan/chitin deacetylase (PgdA/CDA1 family)
MRALKQALLGAATSRPIVRAVRPTMERHATIFMLHRFRNPETGSDGMDPAVVRQGLARLRADGFELLSLDALFTRLVAGEPLRGAVAFTIDDGYLDHATVAGPTFAEFDCPVTTFLCTGFLDRKLWFWWDRIAYVFEKTRRRDFLFEFAGRELLCEWTDEEGRRRSKLDFIERCKRVPDAEKLAAIVRLAKAAEVSPPDSPPPECAPMSWEQARACEKRGMNFGPHTLTHPILSQTPDAQSEAEIRGSWFRLKEELSNPVPVFCYPNGSPADFGIREMNTFRAVGLAGAVVGTPGYAGNASFKRGPEAPFLVRRFAYPHALPMMVQYASGIVRLKQRLRNSED